MPPRTLDELLAEALKLPEKARAWLAQSLIASLEEGEEDVDPTEVEQAWLAEVRWRAAELDARTVRTRPAPAVFQAARDELRELRARRNHGD